MFWSREICINDGSGWSLWSKDIIVLITADSRAGPQAWVDAYHDEHPYPSVESLPIKSGALQGVVVVDNALNHRFESLHIVYDGINGQLPNLDLFNTAVSIASGQMGIGVSLQRMWNHKDSYRERLQTMLRGMVSQGLGHTSGPHSSFIPYHIDAITLQAVGDGWQDEMAMGRCIESIFRSLNNLLEHFHQSFFFYLLMQANRFVSIGTYLPSAMLVAVNFTIMAIALWVQSGRSATPKVAAPIPFSEKDGTKKPEMEVIMAKDGMVAIAPKQDIVLERQLFLPITLVVAMHFIGVIPLYVFNHTTSSVISLSLHPHQTQIMIRKLTPPSFHNHQTLHPALQAFTLTSLLLPSLLALSISHSIFLSPHHLLLAKCISLLLLGMFLATLSTLNFSLALLVGLFSTPLSFLGTPPIADPSPSFIPYASSSSGRETKSSKVLASVLLHFLSPPVVAFAGCSWWGVDVGEMLLEAAFGWTVSGLWTQVAVWCIWWPAWLVGAVVASPLL